MQQEEVMPNTTGDGLCKPVVIRHDPWYFVKSSLEAIAYGFCLIFGLCLMVSGKGILVSILGLLIVLAVGPELGFCLAMLLFDIPMQIFGIMSFDGEWLTHGREYVNIRRDDKEYEFVLDFYQKNLRFRVMEDTSAIAVLTMYPDNRRELDPLFQSLKNVGITIEDRTKDLPQNRYEEEQRPRKWVRKTKTNGPMNR